MFSKSKEINGLRNVMLLLIIFAFIGSSFAWAKPPSTKRVKITPEQRLKFEIGDFRMHLTAELNESVLRQITAKDTKSRIIELGNWPYAPNILAPMEVACRIAGKDIRIRNEHDFVIIWYRSPVSLVKGKANSLDIIKDAANDILGQSFIIGGDNTISIKGTDSYKKPNAKLVAPSLPKEIPGTGAIVFRYSSVSNLTNLMMEDWILVQYVSVLVKGKDAVIVFYKLKARQGGDKPVYEGLKAAKVRQSKEEKEKNKARPVLARDVIFDKNIDTMIIPDALLNGCMWPIDDKEKVGVKDVGSASKLRPSGKKWNKKKN